MSIIIWLAAAIVATTNGAKLSTPSSVNPVNASPCDGSDWSACRTAFADAVFGEKVVPRAPDFVFPRPDYVMSGLPGPGNGTGVGSVRDFALSLHVHVPLVSVVCCCN